MSAMSASSPPAGLMPLSLIAEHKSSVPPSVQPLPRAEKCPQAAAVQPPAVKPNVANGMEVPVVAAPIPMVVPQQPDISHPITAIETSPPPLPTPPTHQPNLPCGGKAESNNSHPECHNSTNESSNRGEEAVGAPVPDVASQLPVSAAVAVPPPPPVIVEAAVPEVVEEVEESKEEEKVAIPPEVEPVQAKEVPKAVSPQQPPVMPVEPKIEPPTPTATEASLPSPAQPPTPALSPPPPPLSPSPPPPAAAAPPKAEQAKVEPKPPRAKRPPKVKSEGKPKAEPAKEEAEEEDDKKPKRKRLPTQIYQSPIPELNLIAKISKIDKTPVKMEEKLIVFYKHEFLAVRNTEGSFYVCQAMQNIYRSSSKIKIRWLSKQANEIYIPDFYDHTEFDCILTTLSLDKVAKDKFKLPEVESQRTESILKRAIDVEKGLVDESTVTEEHPDGLDLSLYRNEDQLKRKKSKSKSRKKYKSSGSESSPPRSKSRRHAKKMAKPTKAEVVKKIAGRSLLASKRRARSPSPAPAPAPASKKSAAPASKKAPLPPPSTKKEATLPPKKDARTAAGKRKPPSPVSSPAPDKKPRRDPPGKKKSGATGGAQPKASSTTPAATRRTLRNAK